MATGGDPNPWASPQPWWWDGWWVSTQTLAAVEHGLRYGPRQQPRSRRHLGCRWQAGCQHQCIAHHPCFFRLSPPFPNHSASFSCISPPYACSSQWHPLEPNSIRQACGCFRQAGPWEPSHALYLIYIQYIYIVGKAHPCISVITIYDIAGFEFILLKGCTLQ